MKVKEKQLATRLKQAAKLHGETAPEVPAEHGRLRRAKGPARHLALRTAPRRQEGPSLDPK